VTTGLLGVDYFLALALATAALGVVPFIGAIVSGVLVVLVTWATAGTTAALVALAVFVAYQQAEALVLQPMIQRRTISIDPLVVIVAVLLGMSAAGVFGAVVALPMAAAAKVVAKDVLAQRRRAWRTPREDAARSRGATHAHGAPAEAHH
jgi:predicted PurR-regulated permease PerM